MKIDYNKPVEIYRESDEKYLARFPQGLNFSENDEPTYEYDEVFKPIWANILIHEGITIDNAAKVSYGLEDNWVPLKHHLFAKAFFEQFYLSSSYARCFKSRNY